MLVNLYCVRFFFICCIYIQHNFVVDMHKLVTNDKDYGGGLHGGNLQSRELTKEM